MLYLTRNARQALIIDGKIRIVVRAIKDGRGRVGIEAPKQVEVMREEALKPGHHHQNCTQKL